MTLLLGLGIAVGESHYNAIDLEGFEYESPAVELDSVRITYYEPLPWQCQGNPLITANGSHIDTVALRKKEIHWCAVSRDIEAIYPMGSEIEVFISEGHRWNGTWKIMDRTSARLTKTIDILSNTDKGGCYRGKVRGV